MKAPTRSPKARAFQKEGTMNMNTLSRDRAGSRAGKGRQRPVGPAIGNLLEDTVHWLVLCYSCHCACLLGSCLPVASLQISVKGRDERKKGRKTGGEKKKEGEKTTSIQMNLMILTPVRDSRTDQGWPRWVEKLCVLPWAFGVTLVSFLGWSQMVVGPGSGELVAASGSHRWHFCLSGRR